MSDLTDWSKITDENNEDISTVAETVIQQAQAQSSGNIKRRRGRPPKITASTPTSTPSTPPAISPRPMTPERSPLPEESIPTGDLLSMFLKEEMQQQQPKRGILRFSGDSLPKAEEEPDLDEDSIREQLDHEILLKLYESFFTEPLSKRHNIRKRSFDDKTPKKTIESELKKLQRSVGSSDPASDLGRVWAGGMGFAEQFAVAAGYPLMGLGDVAKEKAKTPEFLDTFRELLIKYPKLRTYLVLGGFPEIKLLLYSGMIAKDVLEANVSKILLAQEAMKHK